MILLTCARLPCEIDKNLLAATVGSMFSNPENNEYIENIRNRGNNNSACESLFALSLLYRQILELPCPRTDVGKLVFARNENGKPYFKGSELKFSISHSKGYVVCSSSYGEELGVDIEASDISRERAEKLASRYFAYSEQRDIDGDPERFARKWTEKEAKAKFFGKSIESILSQDKKMLNGFNFDKISLHFFTFGKIPITLCTQKDFSTVFFTVR